MTNADAILTLLGELRQQIAMQAAVIAQQQADIERLTSETDEAATDEVAT